MKEKNGKSLHGEVKSFRKVAEARLEEVFFTHPEYRKLNTAAAVNWMIDRINTLNYPFSTKDKTMVSVWKQVLHEKREEMIAGIKDEPDKVKIEIAAGFDPEHIKLMMAERGISNAAAATATGLSPASIWIYRTGKNLKNKVVTPGVRKLLEYIESQPIKEPKIKKTDKTAGQGIAAKSQGDDQGNPRLGVSRKLQAIPLASDKILGKSNEEEVLGLVQTIYVMIRDADLKEGSYDRFRILGAVVQLLDLNYRITRS